MSPFKLPSKLCNYTLSSRTFLLIQEASKLTGLSQSHIVRMLLAPAVEDLVAAQRDGDGAHIGALLVTLSRVETDQFQTGGLNLVDYVAQLPSRAIAIAIAKAPATPPEPPQATTLAAPPATTRLPPFNPALGVPGAPQYPNPHRITVDYRSNHAWIDLMPVCIAMRVDYPAALKSIDSDDQVEHQGKVWIDRVGLRTLLEMAPDQPSCHLMLDWIEWTSKHKAGGNA